MNPKELIELLESKLQQTPSNEDIKGQLASLLMIQGNLNRAEDLYQEIISLNPSSQNALWGLAKINWQKNAYDKAYSYMSQLSSLSDNKLNKEQALIYAKLLAKKSHFPEASQWLDTAIAQDSSLLQSEITLLKFIKHNLSMQKHQQGQDDKHSHEGMIGIPIPFPLPQGSSGRHTQYIVLEISHFDSSNMSSEPLIEADHEKEELSQVKKINTFEQVGGLNKVKQALIQELVLPLKNPQLCSLYSKSTNPKVLLYGPPGCGKTLVTKALAAEAEITFFPLRASDFLDLSYEEAEMKLAYLLQLARDNKPSIIFIDEMLWVGHNKNEDYGDSESYFYRSNILNNLLEALSGNYPMNTQIGLLATTSTPWSLDPSFLIPTRINKHIFVNPPSAEERAEILQTILIAKQTPVILPEKIDCLKVANSLKHILSGADLEELVEETLADLLIETVVSMQKGELKEKDKKQVLSTERLIRIGKKLKSIPAVEIWMSEAKTFLKAQNSHLKHLWAQIEDGQNSFSRISVKNKLISPK